jgi:membrane protease YdiL (CAAX protease family)
MCQKDQTKIKIASFLTITFGMLVYASILAFKAGSVQQNMGLGMLIMWSPAIGTIITCLLFQRNLRGLGWKFGKIKYLLLSYIIPMLVGLVTYSLIWFSGLGQFKIEDFFANNTCGILGLKNPPFGLAMFVMLTFGLLLRLLFAFGEEIGWRGFLIPHLTKLFSLKKAALISGMIWFLFHTPGLFFLDYYSQSRVKSTVFFMIMAISASIIMFWIRIKSGSLWTGAIFHASHNLAIQGIFNGLTKDTGNTLFFSGEFGLGLALVYTILAIWFWKRLGHLQPHT